MLQYAVVQSTTHEQSLDQRNPPILQLTESGTTVLQERCGGIQLFCTTIQSLKMQTEVFYCQFIGMVLKARLRLEWSPSRSTITMVGTNVAEVYGLLQSLIPKEEYCFSSIGLNQNQPQYSPLPPVSGPWT